MTKPIYMWLSWKYNPFINITEFVKRYGSASISFQPIILFTSTLCWSNLVMIETFSTHNSTPAEEIYINLSGQNAGYNLLLSRSDESSYWTLTTFIWFSLYPYDVFLVTQIFEPHQTLAKVQWSSYKILWCPQVKGPNPQPHIRDLPLTLG